MRPIWDKAADQKIHPRVIDSSCRALGRVVSGHCPPPSSLSLRNLMLANLEHEVLLPHDLWNH